MYMNPNKICNTPRSYMKHSSYVGNIPIYVGGKHTSERYACKVISSRIEIQPMFDLFLGYNITEVKLRGTVLYLA